MARDVHPEIKRAIGAGDLHASKADKLLDQAAGKTKRSISPSSGFKKIDDEITGVNHRLDELRAEIRQKQPSQSEIHVHVGDSKPDSDPPESGAQSGFSVEGPMGWQLRARGRVAWAVVVLVALVVAGVLLGRVTAPHGHRAPETTAPR